MTLKNAATNADDVILYISILAVVSCLKTVTRCVNFVTVLLNSNVNYSTYKTDNIIILHEPLNVTNSQSIIYLLIVLSI